MTIEIAIAAIVFFFGGVGLCLLGVFCFVMLKMMQKLVEASGEVTRSSREILAEAKATVAQVKDVTEKNFGDSSALSRAAKSVTSLTNQLPEVLGGLKVFNETFSVIFEKSFDQRSATKPRQVPANQYPDDSQFIPYNETQAADFERTAINRQNNISLSEDDLAVMRTDEESRSPEPPAVPEMTPPSA